MVWVSFGNLEHTLKIDFGEDLQVCDYLKLYLDFVLYLNYFSV